MKIFIGLVSKKSCDFCEFNLTDSLCALKQTVYIKMDSQILCPEDTWCLNSKGNVGSKEM